MKYMDNYGHPKDDSLDKKNKENLERSGAAEKKNNEEQTDPVVPEGENSVAPKKKAPGKVKKETPDKEDKKTDETKQESAKPDKETNFDNTEDLADENQEDVISKKKIKKTEKIETEEDKINYELLSKEDLVKVFGQLLNDKTFKELRSEVDEIQDVYSSKLEIELAKKKEKFIAEGGSEPDFKPVNDPVDKKMEELVEKYKSLKSEFNKHIEQEKDENLIAKQEILEEFRLLMEGQESFEHTFRKFKQLQKRWFNVGIIPKQNVKDLWNSYNFFVDKFNDYVKINKELRVMDLKKNLDQKILLCEKAESLALESNVPQAFKTLQKLHAQWREVGPVPREDKDTIWERFKAATSEINKAHQNLQIELKDSLVENLQLKMNLCEKAEAIAITEPNKHNEWVEKTNELLDIQKEWKTIGYAPKKDNNQIYQRFRKACDTFFEKKAKFYAATFEYQKENLEQKKEIIAAAEELKDNTDWKSTTDKLIELQKRWKEVGPIPRKESDKLWKKFRAECDHFFNKKSEFFSGKNESYEENLKAKEDLIAEMKEFEHGGNPREIRKALEEYQLRYNEIGFVPVESKDIVRDNFRDAMNAVIEKSVGDENEKSLIRYRIRIASILSNPRANNKLNFERDKLINKLQQLRNDIGVWENNIGFFKQTESAEDTISEFSDKIEDARNRINLLERKIKIIDESEDGVE
ncbi:MAG: DUF349 domain-containing protein [Bacteroidales bacterium]